jgi:hypothetical protein
MYQQCQNAQQIQLFNKNTAKTVQAERKLDDDNEISRGYLMPLLQVEGYIALNKAEQWT